GRTQLLQMRVTDPDVTAGLEVIRQAAMDGGQTVRRIQQYTRVREELQHEVLHLPSVAAEVIEITKGKWKNEAQRRGVKIEIRIESKDPAPILGTRAEIREALTNLIFNAVVALSMVYGIVSRHRGSIEVESKEQAGTVVRMRFPAVDPQSPALSLPERVSAPYQARILVVDDEVDLVSIMRDALQREGHVVVT